MLFKISNIFLIGHILFAHTFLLHLGVGAIAESVASNNSFVVFPNVTSCNSKRRKLEDHNFFRTTAIGDDHVRQNESNLTAKPPRTSTDLQAGGDHVKNRVLQEPSCRPNDLRLVKVNNGQADLFMRYCLPPLTPQKGQSDEELSPSFEQELLGIFDLFVRKSKKPEHSSAIWLTGNDSLVLCIFLFIVISAYLFN